MDKVQTCLWFDVRIEEAVNFYVSVFPNSRIVDVSRYPAGSPIPAESIMTMTFELDGRPYMALNGGEQIPFSWAVSLVVDCADQAEVDRYWDKLLAGGGKPSQCGWLQDRFGLSWQIVPRVMAQYMGGADRARAARVMQAMLTMRKIDVAAIERAAAG